MRQRINQILLGLGMLTITLLSLIDPAVSGGSSLSMYAPLTHLMAYFCVAAGLLVVFHDTPQSHLEAILAAAAFGFVLELVQGWLPWRYFGWGDILVNTLGASLILLDHHLDAATWFINREDALIERLVSGES